MSKSRSWRTGAAPGSVSPCLTRGRNRLRNRFACVVAQSLASQPGGKEESGWTAPDGTIGTQARLDTRTHPKYAEFEPHKLLHYPLTVLPDDAAGNLKKDDLGCNYTRDAEGRMASVSGCATAGYIYNALGQ